MPKKETPLTSLLSEITRNHLDKFLEIYAEQHPQFVSELKVHINKLSKPEKKEDLKADIKKIFRLMVSKAATSGNVGMI